VVLLLIGLLAAPAQAGPPAQAGSAILTVLAAGVEAQAPGAGTFSPVTADQVIAVGTRVRTTGEGRAVLTFQDGTTATLDPNTELSVDRIQPGDRQRGSLLVGAGLGNGRLWVQVTGLIDIGSRFQVQAGDVTMEALAGVSGFRKDPDNTVACWAIAGESMKMDTPSGSLVLLAGQQATLAQGKDLSPAIPRRFGPGLLEVQSEGAMLARVVTPQNLTVGFPLHDLVVNQVQDATTSLPTEAPHRVRIPGPGPGSYRLVLEPQAPERYRVQVKLSLEGEELSAVELSGAAQPGERLLADLTTEVRDGAPRAMYLATTRPLVGDPPGRFVYP
jgi:hypothetical protein